MDDDLMARRLRPPSQPSPQNPQPAQPSSPWDIPLTDGGSFAPAEPQRPQQDPPFAPPNPAARADVPWDRPASEPWPPAEDSAGEYSQTWSAQAGPAASHEPQPEWLAADAVGDASPPWDRPVPYSSDQSLDPDDAMAPVVGDVAAPAGVWAAWDGFGSGNGHNAANGYGAANGNGAANANGRSTTSGDGIRYVSPGTPEPMTVAAHSDQPRPGDEPRPDAWVDAFEAPMPNSGTGTPGDSGHSLPEWPAEDDLTSAASPSRGPVMPEDSWPVTPQQAAPPPQPAPWDEAPVHDTAPEPTQRSEQPPPSDQQPVQPIPTDPQPTQPPASAPAPVVHSAQIVPSPAGSPQNMVLRIELAIVDESRRSNPADAAKRVGPDADVRGPEYEPRNQAGRASMPEPEYVWAAPPDDTRDETRDQQRRPRRGQQPQPRHITPPPSAWQPSAQPPQPAQPTQMDWDLPQVGGPLADQPAPWSTPNPQRPPQPQVQLPVAPPPTWAMTEPTPPYAPAPPQYMPPPSAQYPQPVAPQYPPAASYHPQLAPHQPAQQPTWPPAQSADPLYGLPAAPIQQPNASQPYVPQPPNMQPSSYQPAPYSPGAQVMPTQNEYPVQSASAAGSRARTGQAAADQADLWFLSTQPAAAALEEDDAQPEGRSSALLTTGLTIGFALLVIVLVLVFIQLMTSLLR